MMTAEDMNKDVTIQVRCTAEEHARWLAAAEAEDRTLSNWLRRQANDAAPSVQIIADVKKLKAARPKKGGR